MNLRTILPADLSPIDASALLCGGVAPRPIALASTISKAGIRNLSPFSFFNAFGSNPPTVAFAPNRRGRDGTVKHTYLNAVATGEFVIAAVSHAMLHPMNVASAEWPAGKPLGYDALPEALKQSRILTANDLGQLANSSGLPDLASMGRRPGDPADAEGLERALQAALARGHGPGHRRLRAWPRLHGHRVRAGQETR